MTKNETIYTIRRPNLKGTPQNRTTLFMLPSIGFKEEKTGIRLLKYYGFVNCYLAHKQSIETYPDCLVLVFNPTSEALDTFKDFYNIYKTYPNFVDDYMIDFNVIAVVFRILPKWLPTFREFLAGRYSHMSKEYMDLFKRTDPDGKTKATDAYYIMKKDPDYRRQLEESLEVKIDKNAELMSPLNMEDEIFSYEQARVQQTVLPHEQRRTQEAGF